MRSLKESNSEIRNFPGGAVANTLLSMQEKGEAGDDGGGEGEAGFDPW